MIRALGYVGIASRDLAEWRSFGSEILGLQAGQTGEGDGAGEAGEALSFRMDERWARFVIERSDHDGVAFLGWEVAGPADLAELQDRLGAAGFEATMASPASCDARHVQGLLRCIDPSGIPLEFFHGQRAVTERFRPGRPISGFMTGPLGMGHLVLAVDDIDRAVRFYRDTLGFRMSDRLGSTLYFLRCNARHHSIGLADVGGEPRLLHVMLEVASLDDVGRALDLCLDRGIAVSTIGVHTNDRMTSFYVRTPSSFEVEYGWNGLLVDDETWAEATIERPSVWGHRQIDSAHPPAARPLQKLGLQRH